MPLASSPIVSPIGQPIDFTGSAKDMGIHSREATQRYILGTRKITWDGRVFKYGRAGNTLYTQTGAQNMDEEVIKYAALAASGVVGADQVKITVADTDGIGGDGAIAKDELIGGYVVIYDVGDVHRQHFGILGNTAVAAGGGTIVLDLDGYLWEDVTITTFGAEVLGNPYRNLQYVNFGYASVMGIPMVPATVGQFHWEQTWGPICLSPGGLGVGGGAEERGVCFGGNGALFEHNVGDSADQRQYAGFIIQADSAGGDGPPFIMLQISI